MTIYASDRYRKFVQVGISKLEREVGSVSTQAPKLRAVSRILNRTVRSAGQSTMIHSSVAAVVIRAIVEVARPERQCGRPRAG
jgi:hypothetical protein